MVDVLLLLVVTVMVDALLLLFHITQVQLNIEPLPGMGDGVDNDGTLVTLDAPATFSGAK
jgi:hypothetical protein